MASTDFYLDPKTLSVFFMDAVKRDGFGELIGWRSAPVRNASRGGSPQAVEAMTREGRILRIGAGATGRVEVEDITEAEHAVE